MNTCEKCKFWLIAGKEDDGLGACRRFPPTILSAGESYWAITSCEDWCGEFQHACPHVKNV
jgi:hypothetical protein